MTSATLREPRIADLTPRETFRALERITTAVAYARIYQRDQLDALLGTSEGFEEALESAETLVRNAYQPSHLR